LPFTLAHPAAVMPIAVKHSRWLDATALILGSMAPDFEYFIRFQPQAVVGHTFWGFLWYNLPLVLLTAFLWHRLVKKPLLLCMPNIFYRFVEPLYYSRWNIGSFRQLLAFFASAIIGMATHVFWDAFTHINAFFVKRIPFLRISIDLFGFKIAVYQILQQASTVFGLSILFLYLLSSSKKKYPKMPKTDTKDKLVYWTQVALIAVSILCIRMFFTLDGISMRYYGIYIVSLISGFIIGAIAVSLLYCTKG